MTRRSLSRVATAYENAQTIGVQAATFGWWLTLIVPVELQPLLWLD
ncbi:MAG: hypothetical protein ACREMA_10070 [Longimicrobiales bacterium]